MKIYVGHDSREDIAYQVCEHSIKRRDPSAEVIPLKQKQMRDQGLYTRPVDKLASTEFTFTRFFVPYMNDFKGLIIQQTLRSPLAPNHALLNGLIQKLFLFFGFSTDYLVYLFPITYTYNVRML